MCVKNEKRGLFSHLCKPVQIFSDKPSPNLSAICLQVISLKPTSVKEKKNTENQTLQKDR